MEKAKTVLLTGCPGRLSNELCEALLSNGYEVKLVIKPGSDASALPKKASRRMFFDLAEKGSAPQLLLASFLGGVDVVVHVYGIVDYVSPREVLMRENFETTRNLLEASKKAGVKKFIYTSSTSIFRRPQKLPISERHVPTPVNAYGDSKLAAERAVREAGIPYVILRPTIMAGAAYVGNFSKFISAAAKGRARLLGDGENRIAWVHVKDVVAAFLLAIKKPVHNEDFILASDKPLTQKEAYAEVCRELGVKPPAKHASKRIAYGVAHGEKLLHRLTGRKPRITAEEIATISENRFYDVSKAKRLLGWTPRIGFSQTAKELVAAWHKNQV